MKAKELFEKENPPIFLQQIRNIKCSWLFNIRRKMECSVENIPDYKIVEDANGC